MPNGVSRDERLAIEGGVAVRSTPMAPWPHFTEDMVEAAARVLRSGKVNYWTGSETRQFETEFAAYTGTQHAVAVANGTLALELALHALNIGPGDDVVVPARTFVATGGCVLIRGARPVFADIDPKTQNITAETIEAALTPMTRAVIVVHLAGLPCDMDPILELAARRGLFVIEDCAQCHGARYKGRPVGSMGHINAFSFCQDKILTTAGEGGMVTTNDTALWDRAWSYKDHGKSWDAVYHRKHPAPFKWLHESPGTNWRLTEVQSAIGRIALRSLDAWIVARRRNAARLDAALANVPALTTFQPSADFYHSYYKHYAFLTLEALETGWTRDRIAQSVQAEGVFCGSGSCAEIYREKVFHDRNLQPVRPLPVAQRMGDLSLMFQVHPTLSDADIDDTAAAVAKVLRAAAAAPRRAAA